MYNRSTKTDTLYNKDKVRSINLGAYLSIIAISGLIVSTTSVLGMLSALLVSSFALALFYSIDNQLLNDVLMPKFEHYSQVTPNDTLCKAMESKISTVNVDAVIQQHNAAKHSAATLGHVA